MIRIMPTYVIEHRIYAHILIIFIPFLSQHVGIDH